MKLPGLLFIYGFLPVLFVSYWMCRSMRAKNTVLLVFSLIFCASGGAAGMLIMLLNSLLTWLATMCIEKTADEKFRKIFLAANVTLLLPGFCISREWNITAAFYSIQLVSYSMCVYRRQTEARHRYSEVLLYAAMFPQLSAGPLTDYRVLSIELFENRKSAGNMLAGVKMFCKGLARVALLANTCTAASDTLFETFANDVASMSVMSGWLAVIMYGLGTYLRLSGLCAMASGIGLILGFHFPDNYHYPLAAKSVTEFWNRFNTTVTRFFRDNIRLPIGIVCIIVALWYGLRPGLAVCGVYFAVLIYAERFLRGKQSGNLRILPRIYTLLAVTLSLPLVRFSKAEEVFSLYSVMFGMYGNPALDFISETMLTGNIFLIAVSILVSTPAIPKLSEAISLKIRPYAAAYTVWEFLVNTLIPVLLLLVSTAALVGDSANPMMYFYFNL